MIPLESAASIVEPVFANRGPESGEFNEVSLQSGPRSR